MQKEIIRAQNLLNRKKPNPGKALTILRPYLGKAKIPWQIHQIAGLAYFMQKDYPRAVKHLEKALPVGADNPKVKKILAEAYFKSKKYEDAESIAQEVVTDEVDSYKSWMMLGDIKQIRGKLNEALRCFQKCNQLDPKSAQVALKIAQVYRSQGVSEKAIEMYDISIKMNPKYELAIYEKAGLLLKLMEYDAADEVIKRGLETTRGSISLKSMKADILKERGEFDKAANIYKSIIKDHPKRADLRINYAVLLQDLGRVSEAEKEFLQANKTNPDYVESFSNYLFVQHYNPKRTKEELFNAHKKWDKRYAPKKTNRPEPADKTLDKKLRIGLVSSGFRKHPVGWMILAGLENLDSNSFELFFYSSHTVTDEVTERLHAVSTKWIMAGAFDDIRLNEVIRQDKIDILVDLSGHTAGNRLRTMAMEPAPVIVKWVGGLINTTGLKAFDYLITDHIETPKGEEAFYTEKLVRMPDDYIAFTPPDYAPLVSEAPCNENRYITFGCFNNPVKVNEEILFHWSEIMKQIPESRLFLKSKQYGNKAFVNRITDKLFEFGIPKERLIFEGVSPHKELLKAYNRVDIALDPWPYSGGLTTCEALYMGVPVVTKPGPTFAGRHSATHLHNAGFPEWIAESWEEYKKKATELAVDHEKLASLRSGLRKKIAKSSLCDGNRFGAHLDQAFREMWKQRVNGYENGIENGQWKDHINVKLLNIYSKNADKENTSPANLADMSNNRQPKKEHQSDQTKSKYEREISNAWFITLCDETQLCVPQTIKNQTSYILLEQNRWYEPEAEFLEKFIKKNATVLDMDAGYGVFTIPMARAAGEKGKVFACEPDLRKQAYLEKSCYLNKFGQVIITADIEEIYPEGTEFDLIRMEKIDDQRRDLFKKKARVLMVNRPDSTDLCNKLIGKLNEMGYNVYVYASRLELLNEIKTGHEIESSEHHFIGVRKDEVQELIKNGWIYQTDVNIQEPGKNLWKKHMLPFPWVKDEIEKWNNEQIDQKRETYYRALDHVSAAMNTNKPGSERFEHYRIGAELLIELYNSGYDHIPVALTLVRVFNDIEKTGEALNLLNRIMGGLYDNKNFLGSSLPFFLPYEFQDYLLVRENIRNWITVRVTEAWIMMKERTLADASQESLKLLAALHNNGETSPQIERWFNVAMMRSNQGYFSQFGEDKVLDDILKPYQNRGYFVDVGAFDPLKYSNTARLNLFGWKGINIDASAESISRFNRCREHDENIFAAVTDINGTVNLYKSDQLGEVNTLSDKHRRKWQDKGVNYKVTSVPSKRLEDILDDIMPESQQIHFMNIDVEDAEMGVLKSNNWEKYRPKVIAIELHGLDESKPETDEIAAKLMDCNYQLQKYISPTGIFIDTLQ